MTEVQNQHQEASITAENNSIEDVTEHPVPQPASTAPDASREAEQEPEKPVKYWQDDKRAKLGAKAREMRAKEVVAFDGDLTDPVVRFGVDADISQVDPALRAPKRDEKGRFAPADDDNIDYNDAPSDRPDPQDDDIANREVELNIYGQRRTVKVADLIANAQKYEAGDTKLQEARAIVENLKHLSALRQHQRGQTMQPDMSGAHQNANPSEQRGQDQPQIDYEAIGEKLQLGSAKEAGEVLKTLVEQVKAEAAKNAQPQPQPDLTTAVRAAQDEITTQAALGEFARANQDIVSDPVAQQVTAQYAHMSMLHDLRNLGFRDEDLASAIRTQADLVAAHKAARMYGLARPTQAILQDASSLARQRLGVAIPKQQQQSAQPAQPAPQIDRSERKRNIMTQPAVRRAPGTNDNAEAPKSVEQSRQERFQRMKQGRGQLTG